MVIFQTRLPCFRGKMPSKQGTVRARSAWAALLGRAASSRQGNGENAVSERCAWEQYGTIPGDHYFAVHNLWLHEAAQSGRREGPVHHGPAEPRAVPVSCGPIEIRWEHTDVVNRSSRFTTSGRRGIAGD